MYTISQATLKVQSGGEQESFACAPQTQCCETDVMCSVDSSGLKPDWACARKVLFCELHMFSNEDVYLQAHD